MSAFPSVQQIDPLSPSAVQNTMGIAANNNATAERGSRERQSNAALKQDSAEKAKYQTFLAGQQTQQLEAQSREAELNRQAEERHAQRQEDLMREMKALDLELDATRDEADSLTDEGAAGDIESKKRALISRKSQLIHEVSARDAVLAASKNGLSSLKEELKTQIDGHVAEKTNLVTNLATGGAQSVAEFLLKANANKELLNSIARPTGIAGGLDAMGNMLANPVSTAKKSIEKHGGVMGAVLSSPLSDAMEGIPDETRRDIVLTNVLGEAGNKVASMIGGDDSATKAINTLAGGLTAMGAASSPEAKQAAQQIIDQSVLSLKQGSNGTLDDYTIHELFRSVADSLDAQSIEVGVKKSGLNKSEADRRFQDVAKGFKDAANLLRANLDKITKPSAREASNPTHLVKSLHLAQGYFDVMNDPANIDAKVKETVDKLMSPEMKRQVDSNLATYHKAAAELPSLREEMDLVGNDLTSGSYMGPSARKTASTQKKARASGARDIAARLRAGKKSEEE